MDIPLTGVLISTNQKINYKHYINYKNEPRYLGATSLVSDAYENF